MKRNMIVIAAIAGLAGGCQLPPPKENPARPAAEQAFVPPATLPAHTFEAGDAAGTYVVRFETALTPPAAAQTAEQALARLKFEVLKPSIDAITGLVSANTVSGGRLDFDCQWVSSTQSTARVTIAGLSEPQARLVTDVLLVAFAETESQTP